MRIVTVAGARPNFVKIAPLMNAMRGCSVLEPILVNTGQHYDPNMAGQFFTDLGIPSPDIDLGVGSGSHAIQTAEVMRRLEPVLERLQPGCVLVVGDVNSTVAAAITAVKLEIPVAHVEAGLRSFDRAMPEEINRVLTDSISDLLFVTEESARRNLLHEGIASDQIHLVGNVMIDALRGSEPSWSRSSVFERFGLPPNRPYALLTLHRPSNVDDPATLGPLLEAVQEIGRRLPVLFSVHPRVKRQLSVNGTLLTACADAGQRLPDRGVIWFDALGYVDFIALVSRARLVLTDSGGIQEETTILGVRCLTLRDTTERPITVTHGTNRVVGTAPERIVDAALAALDQPPRTPRPIPFWDGRAAERIVGILAATYSDRGSKRPPAMFEVASGAARKLA